MFDHLGRPLKMPHLCSVPDSSYTMKQHTDTYLANDLPNIYIALHRDIVCRVLIKEEILRCVSFALIFVIDTLLSVSSNMLNKQNGASF